MALSIHIKKKLKDFELAVDFDMDEGIVGFLGSSGCGKSMTLKCIAGIETPDEGRIVLDDEVLFDKKSGINLSPQKRKVGYLFQNYALFPHMTVKKNIEAGLAASGKSKQEKKEIVERGLSEELKTIIKRDFLVKGFRTAFGKGVTSDYFIAFAKEHFHDDVEKIEQKYTEVYNKRFKKIKEQIASIKKQLKQGKKKMQEASKKAA